MIYDIRLRIAYDYGSPIAGGRHLLMVMPAELAAPAGAVQRVSRARLDVTPAPVEQHGFTDFFGNRVTELVLPGGHDKVLFQARARVERLGPQPGPDLSVHLDALAAEVAAVRDLGPEAPHHFLGPTARIRPDPGIATHARGVVAGAGTAAVSVAAVVAALGQALNRDMTFDAEATTVDTPPAEAFAARRGVCQDFAQVMIAGLRSLGIPAGYVSGYLRTVPPPGKPRLEGADAMHAWVRAWCGRLAGWVEYDPTNACSPAEDHISVARGRDYGDVSPVSGILRIAGGQRSTQGVDVVPLGR